MLFHVSVAASSVSSSLHSSLSGIVQDAQCKFQTVEQVNNQLLPVLDQLVRTSVFRYYKVNLHKECPFWKGGMLCSSKDCQVNVASEDEIPDAFKTEALSSVDYSISPAFTFVKKCELKESDFCVLEDENDTNGNFINLLKNPERFTGYSGDSAAKVWTSIYQNGNVSGIFDDTCVEKRVLHKLISGLHSSISIHICNEYLDRSTGKWIQNLPCFFQRVGNYPDRLENLYFLWAVMTRAVSKLEPFLQNHPFCDGTGDEELVKQHVNNVIAVTSTCPSTFDENNLFSGSKKLKLEIRDAFRNISKIMDCVSCEKCRLWGKIQITGLGTALKVLFANDFFKVTSRSKLTRSELVAFMNAYHRISESVRAVGNFYEMDKQKLGKFYNEKKKTMLVVEQGKVKIDFTQSHITSPTYLMHYYAGILVIVLGAIRMIYKGFHNEMIDQKLEKRIETEKKMQ